jgi:integrase
MANYKYRASFTDIRGKRHEVYANTKKELEDKKQKAIEKYNSDTSLIDNEHLTLDQYFDEWIAKKERNKAIKGATVTRYKSWYNKHIKPDIGSMKVQAISQRQIENFQSRLQDKGTSDYTCNRVMGLLKDILKGAVKSKVIKENPSRDVDIVKPEKSKATKTIHRGLSREEQTLFMNELKGDYYYEFLALMLSTGMRVGEVAVLKYTDFDFKKNCIHVTKTLTRDSDGKTKIGDTPKTDESERDIPMSDSIKAIIESQKAKNGVISISDTFFKAVNGGFVRENAINNTISRTLKRIKEKEGVEIEHFTSHCLRDTFATRFLEQTKDLQTLKTILGHTSLAMTADLYAHVLDDEKQKAMQDVKIDIGLAK